MRQWQKLVDDQLRCKETVAEVTVDDDQLRCKETVAEVR